MAVKRPSDERLLAATVQLECNIVRNVTTLRKRGLAELNSVIL